MAANKSRRWKAIKSFWYNKAQDLLVSSTRIDRKNSDAYYALGELDLAAGFYSDAKKHLKKAAKLGNEKAKKILANPPVRELEPWYTRII